MRFTCWTIALTVLLPQIVEAQGPSVAAGTRVRVTAPNFGLEKHVTTVSQVRGDSMVVVVKGRQRTIAFGDATALEVSTGRRMRVLPFALLGLGVGAAGGFALGYATYDEGAWCCTNSASADGALVGGIFGAIGFFTGALVGVARRGDNWESAHPTIKPSIGSTRGGAVSVGLSRAF